MPQSNRRVNSVTPINPHVGALWAIGRGFRVLPVKPGGKDPFDKDRGDDPFLCGGVHIATTDAATVESWFRHNPNINYGIAAGHGLAILDCDTKQPTFQEDYLSLPYPTTLEIETPTGGAHIFLRVDFDAGQRKLAGAESIDVRARGGYVVGPGSIRSDCDGRRYRIALDAPVAACPPELAARISRREKPAADAPKGPLCEEDLPAAKADGWRLVSQTAPMAESEGIGRNNMVHRLAGLLKRLGLSQETCLEMVQDWNSRCFPPQPDDDVRKTVESAYVNGDWPIGADRPEAEFNPIGDPRTAAGAAPGAEAQQLLERVSDIDLAELARRRANALIKGILHPRDDATLYGRSTAGKSHVGVHVSYHVALGLPWAGRKVKRAPVLYICLEGVDGFRERMLAAAKAYGDPGAWFARLTVPVTLDKTADGAAGGKLVIEAAKRLEADCGQPVGLIIVDTRARATPGDDEIKAADIMAYARRVAEIARGTGAAVLTIDHTNEAGELRGAKSKGAAADVILEAVRNDDGTERAVIAKKIKDGVEMPLFDFSIKPVPLGVDPDGDAFGSAVIETTPPKAKEDGADDTDRQRKIRNAYLVVKERIGRPHVSLDDVGTEYKAQYLTPGKDEDAAKKAKANSWGDIVRKEAWPTGLTVNDRDGVPTMGPVSRAPKPQDEFAPINPADLADSADSG
jgi:hypothetical protein